MDIENVEDIVQSDAELKALKNQYEIEKELAVEKDLQTTKELNDIMTYKNYNGEDRVIHSSMVIDKIKKMPAKKKYITGGYSKFDDIIDGFDEEELVIISGITGNGKTLFARSLTYQFSVNGDNCVWFSYEESNEALLSKYKYKEGNAPSFYLPRKNVTTQLKWIEQRIIESKVKYKTSIAFIDHLHFLVPLKYVINTSILIGGIMRELKKICIRNKFIIFLIAHTNKVQQTISPDLSQLRDSSFIAQESDRVLFVKRHGVIEGDNITFENKNSVYILKNRKNGKLGTVPFYYNFEEGILNESV